ncbi:MAG TPA: TetR family transcriptional regulator, partial [Candidatus Dormibacteraeota bacterium]|nr:TetR family transcriptional regulator [Candidatus Dormibacteraeota bacterium]
MSRVAPRATATSEQRKQQLVKAAFTQIAERGFEGLRTREVAAEVGVNIATLHYYFPTKEALIRGVLEHAMGRDCFLPRSPRAVCPPDADRGRAAGRP